MNQQVLLHDLATLSRDIREKKGSIRIYKSRRDGKCSIRLFQQEDTLDVLLIELERLDKIIQERVSFDVIDEALGSGMVESDFAKHEQRVFKRLS